MTRTLEEAATDIGATVVCASPREGDDTCIVCANWKGGAEWVTWEFAYGNLILGHYFTTHEAALADFDRRIQPHRFSADNMLVNLS
jgi:hypothetical protein